MALKSMSLKKANEVYSLYADLLADNETVDFHSYSELKGYDIFDVDHAIKVVMANRVFRENINNIDIDKLKNAAEVGLTMFTWVFVPDEYVFQLNKLPKESDEYFLKKIGLSELPLMGMTKLFDEEKKECIATFIDFCLWAKENSPNYWESVYKRLGVEP